MRFRSAEEEREIRRIKGRVPRKVTRPPSAILCPLAATTIYRRPSTYIIFLSYLPLLSLFLSRSSLSVAKHTNGRTYTYTQAEHCRGLIGSYRAVMSHNGADNAWYNTPPASKPFNPRQPPPSSSFFSSTNSLPRIHHFYPLSESAQSQQLNKRNS